MEKTILLAGKEHPHGQDMAVAATRHSRNVVLTVESLGEQEVGKPLAEDVFPAVWNRASAISARSVVLQGENQCGVIGEAVLFFDAAWFSPHFPHLTPEACSRAMDSMIGGYLHLAAALLKYFEKRGEGTLVFVVKDAAADDASGGAALATGILPGVAEAAFRGLGESVALSCMQDERLRVVLVRAACGMSDSLILEWILEALDTPNGSLGKVDARKGPQWLRAGTKGGKLPGILQQLQRK